MSSTRPAPVPGAIAWAAGTLAAFTACAVAVAGPPSAAPDGDMLEFLGSVDTAEHGLHEYLARTDLDKLAKAPAKPPPTAPSPPAAPAPVAASRGNST